MERLRPKQPTGSGSSSGLDSAFPVLPGGPIARSVTPFASGPSEARRVDGDPARLEGIEACLAIIPARNESERIGDVVRACRAHGLTVWVVDDGSSDDSAECAREAGAYVWRLPEGRGKTAALRWAIQRVPAHFTWLCFLDGDGQHRGEDFPQFWAERNDADLVCGNRWTTANAMPLIRRWTNRAMTALINRLTGGDTPDTQCGYRLVRRRLVEGWQPFGQHYEFETELYVHALRREAAIRSVPLPSIYAGERSKIFWPRDTLRFARCLWRLRKK